MKEIRNDIVHEYIDDGLLDVLEDVLSFSEKLIFIMRTTLKYTHELK
ncbi:MAG TPA: capsule biosynthesis protein [Campylobacterales bacterium]|nr:capsule biosynthesis protein [Campylobacterales bacterium]